MRIEPFAAIGDIEFGSDQAIVVKVLGEPQRIPTSRLGDTADEARRNNEQEAFKKLIDDFTTSWPKVLERHGQKG